MKKLPIIMCLLAASAGCMEHQLRDKTVRLSTTTTDLLYMQILDNLARTIDNPEEMPYFDVPAVATAQIQRSLSATATPQWGLISNAGAFAIGRFLFNQQQVAVNPQQLDQESWQITPMADPDRLVLMHCAFLKAIGAETEASEKILHEFYFARKMWVDMSIKQLHATLESWEQQPRKRYLEDSLETEKAEFEEKKAKLDKARAKLENKVPTDEEKTNIGNQEKDIQSRKKQIQEKARELKLIDEKAKAGEKPSSATKPPLPINIPYNTFIQPGWYGEGKKHDVPKGVCFVGHHGDKYVWVTPEGMAGLNRFTLAILDFYNINNPSTTSSVQPPPVPLAPSR
jgi:hypothetical protein